VYQPLTLTPSQDVSGEWLAGNIAVKGVVGVRASDGPEAMISGSCAVLYRTRDRTPHYSPTPGRGLKLAGYTLRTDRIARFFGGDVPEQMVPFIKHRVGASLMLTAPVSPRLKRLAGSLFACRLNGPLRAIFMEGVVLQLFALQAAGYDDGPRSRPLPLSPKERAATEAARDRLLSNMRNPPTLGELAAEAGMSEKALNSAFRTLFGATVFEVLRDERLEHARLALQSGDVPTKTIAYRVGYNHVTNFITAFTRRYGVAPRQFVRKRKGEQSRTEAGPTPG
jgi:AraC-like DNA-binding protein